MDIDEHKRQGIKTIDDEINKKIKEAASSGNKVSYKRTVEILKKERGEHKSDIEDQLFKEQESAYNLYVRQYCARGQLMRLSLTLTWRLIC